ncbi:hypothetical protein GJ496_003305 [Pomphorhynchus laevis]|nr:hypothetical protein GJ496_003305 [Pomphorhynchus laevis]
MTATKQLNKIDFNCFRSRAEDEFLSLIKFITGDKELIISQELFRKIDRITNIEALRQSGVKQIVRLNDNVGMPKYVRVYFIRCSTNSLQQTIKLISDNPKSLFETVHIICVPRIIFRAKHLIEREGLLDHVVLHSLPSWEFICLDDDLLSMEIDNFFARVFLAGDLSWISTVSSALLNIQQTFGKIPLVYTIGPKSRKVYELMGILQEEQQQLNIQDENHRPLPTSIRNRIGHLIIADRSMDYATLFSSQMIYEGLIDECFDINAGILSVPNAVLKIDPIDKETLMILSNLNDVVFSVLRHIHVTGLFGNIKSYAEYLRKEMAKKKENIRSKNVGEIKVIVQTEVKEFLEKERLLQRHLALSEFVMQIKKEQNFKDQLRIERNLILRKDYEKSIIFIQNRLYRRLDWAITMQLMCLISTCYDGIPFSDFETLRKLFLSTHGYHFLPLFLSLEKLEILKYQSSKGTFSSIIHKLSILPTSTDGNSSSFSGTNSNFNVAGPVNSVAIAEAQANAKVLSSVFDGYYVPILCRMIEFQLFNPAMLDDLALDIGDCFQTNDTVKSFRHHALTKMLATEMNPADRCVLVVFVGGCTHTEINALRLLATMRGYNIYFLTTNIWTSERFLKQIELNSI